MVEFKLEDSKCSGIKIKLLVGGQEVGRTFVYILFNELHSKPFAFVEDVFIEEEFRGSGLGKDLMEKVLEVAKNKDCYKLIFTSRFEKERLHAYYEKQGFVKHGYEFRLDF